MKKSIFKKLLSLLTVFTLSIGVLCFAGCKNDNKTDLSSDLIIITGQNSSGIRLTSTKATVYDNYLEQTLTATIENGGTKAEDLVWSVKWADKNVLEVISSYLIVEASSTNNSIASVKCFKNFEDYGQAIVEVCSSINANVKATCVVTYVGEPTALNILSNSTNVSGKTITINEGDFVYYDLVLENLLGVGKKYNDYTFSVKVDGMFKVNCKTYNNGVLVDNRDMHYSASGNSTTSFDTSTGTVLLDLSNFMDYNNYFSWSISNSQLVLSSKKTISKLFNGAGGKESYSGKSEPTNGVKAVLIYYDMSFTYTVTEKVSGLSNSITIKVNPDLSVLEIESITLDKSTISF